MADTARTFPRITTALPARDAQPTIRSKPSARCWPAPSRAIAREPEVELGFTARRAVGVAARRSRCRCRAATLARARGRRGARLRRRGGAASCAITMPALHAPRRAGRRGRARGVRRGRAGAGRGARRARHGGRARQSRPRCRDADAHRSDHPRAQPRRGAARPPRSALMVRERLTGEAPPEAARDGLELVSDWIEEKAGADLDALGLALDDQAAFAALADQAAPRPRAGRGRRRRATAIPRAARRARATRTRAATATQDEDDEGGGERRGRDARSSRARPATRRASSDWSEDEMAEGEEGLGEEGEEGMLPVRPNRPLSDLPPQFDYAIFTTRFDEMVEATELCDEEELGRLRAYLDQQLVHLQGAVTKLANRLQRRLMAQQIAQLGLRPGGRAARRRAAGAGDRQSGPFAVLQGRARHRVPRHRRHPADRQFGLDARPADLDRRDLAPTSSPARSSAAGSRSRSSASPPAPGRAARRARNGSAEGRPPQPGRLNDLRHIVYKKADEPWRRARKNLGLMMREGLLKENIDGEALLWAHNRLIARPEERRILMVISDGAPVDDSTLSVNSRHLSRAPSAPGDRLDRGALAGRAGRDRHRPRRHPLLRAAR